MTMHDDLEWLDALAAERSARAALAAAGEALWLELQDATFGYEGVHWKVQRDAPPVLDAWRALLDQQPGLAALPGEQEE